MRVPLLLELFHGLFDSRVRIRQHCGNLAQGTVNEHEWTVGTRLLECFFGAFERYGDNSVHLAFHEGIEGLD